MSLPNKPCADRLQRILLSLMMNEINASIEGIHALAVWTEPAKKSEKNLNLPTFNVAASEYMKKIGAYLLSLVQQIESSSHSLSDHENEENENENDESEQWLNLVMDECVK